MKNVWYIFFFLVLFLVKEESYSQSPWLLTGNPGTSPSTNIVGTTDANDLTFATNSTGVGSAPNSFWWKTNGGILQMSLDGLGNLDISHNTKSYMIGGYPVLWYNGITSNIYVGVAAGTNTTGSNCTFVGSSAGNTNSSGQDNTFVGANAGYTNDAASKNTFTGSFSGYTNADGEKNSFYGMESGALNENGSENVCCGYETGYKNVSGNHNVLYGTQAGYSATSLSDFTAIGYQAGYLNTGTNNTMLGYLAGTANTTGGNNTFLGYTAGKSNVSSTHNTYVGYAAGALATGQSNTYVGASCGTASSSANFNSFYGNSSGTANATGNSNSFYGCESGLANTGGTRNVYMGYRTAFTSPNSDNNTVVGTEAMLNMSDGDKNTVVGSEAGKSFDTGDDNCFFGYQSGLKNSGGNRNVFLGENSGLENITGYNNTYVGYNSGQSSLPGVSHALYNSAAIGAGTIVRNSDQMILGNLAVNIGIGLSDDPTGPHDKLEIKSGTTGITGLQFTNVTSSYSPGVSAAKFLTVASDGKVILRDIPGNLSYACSSVSSSSDVGYVPVWSSVTPTKEICKSEIFDDGSKVGIGYGSSLPTQTTSPPFHYRLSVNGNINVPFGNNYSLANTRFMYTDGNGSLPYNIYLGWKAGPDEATGAANTDYGNIAIGVLAGSKLSSTERYNTIMGIQAGEKLSGGHDDVLRNTFVGSYAGQTCTRCRNNTFIGNQAGNSFPANDKNTCLGSLAGGNQSGVSGDENTFMGFNASTFTGTTLSQSGAIGANAVVGSDDAISMGDATEHDTRILMGYTNVPTVDTTARLFVDRIADGERAAYFNGTIYTPGVYNGSDAQLKQNIQPMGDVTSILDQLNPKTYTFDQIGHPEMALPSGLQYGLIADDVEAILPGLVETEYTPELRDTSGNVTIPTHSFKALNYVGLIPILLKGMQQQKDRIDQLEQQLQNCCSNSSQLRTSNPAIAVELSNSIILNQNDPNPFAEETKITFNIPESVSDAKIVFTDNSSHVIQTVKINERGEGQLIVYASNLTSGIYNYTLIADGKVIDSKKMVCSK